jgi:two-component system nitrogen regulation sensor histidine kinase GlnL
MAVNHGAVMQQQEDILDNLSTSIVVLDSRLNITALNAASQALLETSEARCLGRHLRTLLLHPDDWLHSLKQVVASSNPLARRGIPLFLHTGHEVHVDLLATPISTADGNTHLIIELQAVDRLLKISREEALIHSQETTRAVIRGLAHEIKNPLGGVRGAAQLLARELPNEDLREYTEIIIREADRLRDLVDRLLGPRQQPDLQPINIHEIVEHVRNLINAEVDNRVTIVRDYDPGLPEIPGDKAQLIQAVLNIMRNALQASESTQDCIITLKTRAQRQFTIGPHRHRVVCRVDIIDNGPGIPEELQHDVFIPMVTTRAEGTGLGLSIAQSVVNRHGGLLECSSEPGNTQFTMYLPMENQNA